MHSREKGWKQLELDWLCTKPDVGPSEQLEHRNHISHIITLHAIQSLGYFIESLMEPLSGRHCHTEVAGPSEGGNVL